MQNVLERIFKMAAEELPHKLFSFDTEQVVLYRGFRISKKGGKYYWQDVRYSNFYDQVDPLITENVLEQGFYHTLTMMMVHSDKERKHDLEHQIKVIDNQIQGWVTQSNREYNRSLKQRKGIRDSDKLGPDQKKHKISLLKKQYEKKKALYAKKRRVLREKQSELRAELAFYISRIKSYKFNHNGSKHNGQ